MAQYTFLNSQASTTVVQNSPKKSWAVHTERTSKTPSKSYSQTFKPIVEILWLEQFKHWESPLASRMPVFLNPKLSTRNAGRMPWGTISIKTLCNAFRMLPLCSDNDSWFRSGLIGSEIGLIQCSTYQGFAHPPGNCQSTDITFITAEASIPRNSVQRPEKT